MKSTGTSHYHSSNTQIDAVQSLYVPENHEINMHVTVDKHELPGLTLLNGLCAVSASVETAARFACCTPDSAAMDSTPCKPPLVPGPAAEAAACWTCWRALACLAF